MNIKCYLDEIKFSNVIIEFYKKMALPETDIVPSLIVGLTTISLVLYMPWPKVDRSVDGR
jgi:hypothetical protein